MTAIELLYKKLKENQKQGVSGFIDYNHHSNIPQDATLILEDIKKQLNKGDNKNVEHKNF